MSGPRDVFAEAAELIREVGERSQAARRYRDLATTSDAAFERALALGTVVRRAARTGAEAPPEVTGAITELEGLLRACLEGVARVRSSERYDALISAIRDQRFAHVDDLASEIFTDVVPHREAGTVFWTLSLAGKRGADHFLPPAECARRIQELGEHGVPAASPPPDMGADDQVPAVELLTEPEPAESPLALAIDVEQLPSPPCRLTGTPIVLAYGPRLRAPFRVWGAEASSDEWWTAGGDTYPAYLHQLRAALAPLGIALDGALAQD